MARGIGTNPAWRARRRRVVLPPGLLAVTLLALAGWAYANQTAAARRAISTTAVIEDLGQGPGRESETGARTVALWGTVRYQVNGSDVRARVVLGECRGARCPSYRRGDRVTVAYDPDRVTDAGLLAHRGGRYPMPDARVVILAALGGLCLLVAVFYLVHGP